VAEGRKMKVTEYIPASGDLVKFIVENDNEIYTYDVPKCNEIGMVELQMYSIGLKQLLGVEIPMSIVQWQCGRKIAVFTHDLKPFKGSFKETVQIYKTIRSLPTFSLTEFVN